MRSLAAGVAFAVMQVAIIHVTGAIAAEPPLPAYNAAIAETSVSGVSAGAYMAVQFGTAWSSTIKGVGAIAGGPFGCAEGSLSMALSTCMVGAPPADPADFVKRADGWGRDGKIDDPANLAAQKLYLFSGYNDKTVAPSVGDVLRGFYLHYLGAHAANLFHQTAIGAGHSQVTVAYGGPCRSDGGEYINKCGYDQAGIILQHIYGALAPRNDGALGGRFLSFDQAAFTAPIDPAGDSMDDTGFAYVPASCAANEPCRLHVVLHGCLQSFQNIGDAFVRHAGYNEWADTNHIIVLYPQTQPDAFRNPNGCWDWFGYLDADPMDDPTYLLKSGTQITVLKAMVDRITSGAEAPSAPASSAATAPATLVIADHSDTAIDLAWSAAGDSPHYDVFRAGPGDADFTQIGTISGLSYGDSGLDPATAYRYKVRVSSAPATTPFSPVASATTMPKVPPCLEPGTCPVH